MHLIRINCPNAAIAETIARAAIDARLAACANIAGPVRSIYRWENAIEEGEEIVVFLKCPDGVFDAVAALVQAHHPDETPAILAISVTQATEAFAAWLATETT